LEFLKNFMANEQENENEKYTLKACIDFIEDIFNKILADIDDKGLSIEEHTNRKNKIELLSNFLKRCGVEDIAAKEFVKEYISDLITQEYGLNKENIDKVVKFTNPNMLTTQDKFDILLHVYKTKFGGSGLANLIIKYEFHKLRLYKGKKRFIIKKEDIDNVFSKEKIVLDFEDKLAIVAQKIYSQYKGLGVIDDVSDQNINGISIGVSGLPEASSTYRTYDEYLNGVLDVKQSYDSVWLYFKSKEIYLEFMSFESHAELNRVIDIIHKFNNPGQLSKSNPVIINETAAGSRVTTMISPFVETNVTFLRKFEEIGDLKDLITGKNSEIIIKLISIMVKSCVIAITGEQGSGKTTLLVSSVKEMYPFKPIRMWEGTFEAHLRRFLPEYNIVTITKTKDITGEQGLDFLKKTNGAVTIIQEAAEDIEVAYVFKVAMFSVSTIFGHHAKSFDMLVRYMRNAALNVGISKTESIAEDQVISILDYNIHLGASVDGEERYIERITECIPVADGKGKQYTAVNIVEYDFKNKEYKFKNRPNDEKIKAIGKKLLEEDKVEFIQLLDRYFPKEGD
jgi:pilus assembly protein CpaF